MSVIENSHFCCKLQTVQTFMRLDIQSENVPKSFLHFYIFVLSRLVLRKSQIWENATRDFPRILEFHYPWDFQLFISSERRVWVWVWGSKPVSRKSKNNKAENSKAKKYSHIVLLICITSQMYLWQIAYMLTLDLNLPTYLLALHVHWPRFTTPNKYAS